MIQVDEASDSDATRWSDFISSSGLTHHAYAWSWREIISRSFGHHPLYWIAYEQSAPQQITGILPAFLVKSALFGRAIISVPYLNAGGVVASSEESAAALIARAKDSAAKHSVRYLELRHRASCASLAGDLVRTHKAAMLLPLDADPEKLFGTFTAKLRSQIRRPSKSGVTAEIHPGTAAAIGDFYRVFCENMRDLGTPVYPKLLFELVAKSFGEQLRVITAHHDGEPVAAGITIGSMSNVEIPWASSLRRSNALSPNMLLYWQAIKTACLDGYTTFDFGRSSPGSGPYRFKEQWGAQPQQLHWYYSGTAIPDINPHSPKFELLVKCWQRMPLSAANLLGPWLTRSLP